MEANIIPRNAVRGNAAYNAMFAFTKREFRFAFVAGGIAGALWKTYHWQTKRDISRLNKQRVKRLQAQQKRYDDALSTELQRLGL